MEIRDDELKRTADEVQDDLRTLWLSAVPA
jgi:hypothetical protein